MKFIKVFVLIFTLLSTTAFYAPEKAQAQSCGGVTASIEDLSVPAGQSFNIRWNASYITYEPTGGRNVYTVELYREDVINPIATWTADTNYGQQPPEAESYYVNGGINVATEFRVVATVASDYSCPEGISAEDTTVVTLEEVQPSYCIINNFSATNPNPAYNTGTNLNYNIDMSPAGYTTWNISLVSGSVLPTPYSGTASGSSATGNLTTSHTYKITCGNATPQYVTVTISPPPGTPPENICNEPDASNYGGLQPCQFPTAQTCTDPAAPNYGGPAPCDNPVPIGTVLTPSISGPACVPSGQTYYDVTVSWSSINSNVTVFLYRPNLVTGPGNDDHDKVVYGNPGQTTAAAEFNPRLPGTPPLPGLVAGQEYRVFLHNGVTGGPTVSWTLQQCAPPDQQATGYLDDSATNGYCPSILHGWAWDPDFPNTPTSVHFYRNDVFYSSVNANAYRADLQAAGIGNGNHAFSINMPEAWKTGTNQTIKVYAIDLNGGGNPQLIGSPKTINCPVPPAPSGPISATGCTIPANSSSCNSAVTWGPITNPVSGATTTVTKGAAAPSGTVISSLASGSLSSSITYGPTTFYLNHNGGAINSSSAVASCASGTSWNGTICLGPMSGTITPSSLSCPIPAGQSSCSVTLAWNTVNPVGTSAITAPGMTSVNGNSGSQAFTIPYGGRTFSLVNTGQTLDTESISAAVASCATGTSWNGSICVAPSFNYSLSNSGTSSVTKGSSNVFTTNTITKTLSAGAAESVALSLSGVPSGVSYSISNSTCSPTCNSVITFTISPSASVGNHTITVTGTPLSKTTSFTLAIAGSPMTVSCSVSANSVLLGQPVTWTGTVTGGAAPLSYSWSGTNISAPLPSTNPFTKTYTTIGQKTAQLAVTDADGLQGTCQALTVQVNFDPNFEEF